MKSTIIALFTLSAVLMVAVAQPAFKLQNPFDLFESSWKYQKQLQNLQAEINEVIEQVVVAVSTVLKSSTEETLEQYQALYDDIDEIYAPLLVGFNGLKPSDCRETAEISLNSTISFVGFAGSNCAEDYDNAVRNCIASANSALSDINGLYSQVQMIVVKGFVGKNAFTTPENIEETIESIIELVNNRWAASKPELDSLRSRLASEIAEQNKELGECNEFISSDIAPLAQRFQRMVQTCISFDTPSSKSKSVDLLSGSPAASYKQQFEEFQSELSKLKSKKRTA